MSTTPNYQDATREKLRQLLRSGKLDERVVELETSLPRQSAGYRGLVCHRHRGDGIQY